MPHKRNPATGWRQWPFLLTLRLWWLRSRLRALCDEMRSFPWRILLATTLPFDRVGLEMPAPEEIEVLRFGNNYRRVGISRIEDLARGNRGWGPTSTHVACRAFRLGATYGASISDIHKRHTSPQSNPLTMNPLLASDVQTTASEQGNPLYSSHIFVPVADV